MSDVKEGKTKLAERVEAMSAAYGRAGSAVEAVNRALEALEEAKDDLAVLDRYQRSGQWLKDYEADEAGKIPGNINRGVLSQDGLYNLLSDYDAIVKRLK